MNITVTEVNDSPTANSQAVTTNANTAVSVTLTGNDLETATGDLAFEVSVSPCARHVVRHRRESDVHTECELQRFRQF